MAKLRETFLAKGKRGHVYLTAWKGRKAIVKRVNPSANLSATAVTIREEARYLNVANAHGIGPKLYAVSDDSIIMEFIKGKQILEFMESATKLQILTICRDVLEQCRTFDLLKINKNEMTNPYKHIIVRVKRSVGKLKLEAVMIDFERCSQSAKPKNVTQFLQFLTSGKVSHHLAGKIVFDKETLWRLASEYKKEYRVAVYKKILKQIS